MTKPSTPILMDGTQPENLDGITALPTTAEARDLQLGADVQSGTTKPDAKATTGGGTFPNLPPKFKTVDDLVKSYTELESHLGHRNNEIGQLRSLTDKLLDLKRTEDLQKGGGRSAEPATATADELLQDPTATIRRVTESQTAPLAAELQATRLALIEQQFENKHPGFKQDMQTPEFQNFVRASAYRTRLAQQAVNSNDFGAADELFTAWAEKKAEVSAPAKESEATKVERESALRAAAMVSSSGGDSSGNGGKPIYSRQALIKKRIQDPDGYYDESFQALIVRAYAEGRVK